MFEWAKGLTQKQVDALMLIAPGPLGEGLTYEQAARELGIEKSVFIKRITTFKKNFPEAWENFESLRDVARRQRESLESPTFLGDCNFSEEDIRERF